MALGIVKIYLRCPSQPIGIVRGYFVCGQLVRGHFVAVSCRGPAICTGIRKSTVLKRRKFDNTFNDHFERPTIVY